MLNRLKHLFGDKKNKEFGINNITPIEKIAPKEQIDLIRFFKNELPDSKGRYHKDILQFNHEQIEYNHDFIQWILPTIDKSQFHPEAPTIDGHFKEQLQHDDLAKSNYCKTCQLYLNYIGFHCNKRRIQCQITGRLYELPFHNQLRITRMLDSLNQVGNNQCSTNLYHAIISEIKPDSDKITNSTLEYWAKTQRINRNCNILIGAIAGDIIGSIYKFNPIKSIDFPLFKEHSGFTDDTVMTIANADWLLTGDSLSGIMLDYGNRYPRAGYEKSFYNWLQRDIPQPYNSFGNGSAMRVSAAGWLYDSMERTREVARATANVTHNHPEGIKGAEATASAIYMARNGSSKEEIKEYIEREFHYDLSRTLDNIRPYYHHVESCQETVPEAIIAFLESKDFEDAVRNAVSLGGDTDTLGAITGSIAEAFYGIHAVLIAECKSRIDKGMMTDVLDEFDHVLGRSVDTYSDEVDEIQANQMIEVAIDQYYIQQDKNGMLLFMEVMVTRMQQAGEVVVPYITENPFMSEEQIGKVKAGDTISLDHDVRLKIETVKDADEKEWIGVFTSSEEMHKGSAGNVQMNQSIESILRLALNWEQVNGIVINPFGKYIQMTKKMIELLINGYEYYENERKSKDDENN